jgi:hypothetical protein
VFAGGFDLEAAAAICEHTDEYTMLDVLDSLVRKSLITVEHVDRHARYGMLETIRQFAEELLAATDRINEVRERHAAYFADHVVRRWQAWDGPGYHTAVDWVDAEFANLRAGFRWSADRGDLAHAAAIAAHTALLNWSLQRFEPAGWAESILTAAASAGLAHLPRLGTAAGLCLFTGRPEAAAGFTETAAGLAADGRYEPFDAGVTGILEATAHMFAGRIDRCVEICAGVAVQPGSAGVAGLCGTLYTLPAVGQAEAARALAERTLTAARAHGSPFYIAFALAGYGRAFSETDPGRALRALREGLLCSREHRVPIWEAIIAPDAARLEAAYGELDTALELFDTSIDSQHRAGNIANVSTTLAGLAVLFDRIEQPEVAATIYGASARSTSVGIVPNVPVTLEHLRLVLGDTRFDQYVAAGAAMEFADAVAYAREQIQAARPLLAAVT